MMMVRRHILLAVACLCSFFKVNGQERLFRYTISSDFSVPSVVSSRAFNRVFDGIADVNVGLKINTRKGFYTGPGLAFCFLKAGNNRNASLSPFHTKYYVIGPRWSAGFISGQGSGTQIAMGCEVGYSKVFLNGTPCSIPPASPPPFFHVEPSVSIRFFSGENSSFGARIGYSLMWNRFSPEQACLENYVTFETNEVKQVSQYLLFGLGFSMHLKAMRQKVKPDS
jgi:hypothetical protein